jgi:hypothetical protein
MRAHDLYNSDQSNQQFKFEDCTGDNFFSPESQTQVVSLYATIVVDYVRQEYPATCH